MIEYILDKDLAVVHVHPTCPLRKEDFGSLAKTVDPFIEQKGELKSLLLGVGRFPGWEKGRCGDRKSPSLFLKMPKVMLNEGVLVQREMEFSDFGISYYLSQMPRCTHQTLTGKAPKSQELSGRFHWRWGSAPNPGV